MKKIFDQKMDKGSSLEKLLEGLALPAGCNQSIA